ncbi:hypothetical protein [Streptomyces sp. 6N223]|uniref:hypothetical protein n=1 Tax=Streptomyces sp. 6N223 TaxID=3457412 RepID=UPI003FD3EF51
MLLPARKEGHHHGYDRAADRTVRRSEHRDRAAGRYRDTHTAAFGEDVRLPAPVDLTLDTTVLKTGAF